MDSLLIHRVQQMQPTARLAMADCLDASAQSLPACLLGTTSRCALPATDVLNPRGPDSYTSKQSAKLVQHSAQAMCPASMS